MKIGVLGSGIVAQTLAAGFVKHGYETMVGTRDRSKLAEWNRANPKARLGSFSETAAFGDVVVLAVKGLASAEALRAAGDNVSGKVVIDATNPIADAPPENGLLKLASSLDGSLMERLQTEFPRIRFVKAFSSVGYFHFVDPQFGGVKPTMFICGNDGAAKTTVTEILDRFGWEAADMGTVEAARAIEPLCVLWCIPGLLRNEWNHAFKLLKK
ncbi:MAG TPA: NAD(P)-binding domain-containing protein [Verrucomicrobiae bacterium]|jgi:predicted dinucleotide-binding enzyme|nr:NAD(P)-binding domain-containing protein [Verrucomicrobiae bacterium]